VFLVPARDHLKHHPVVDRVTIPGGLWYVGFVPFLTDFARLQYAGLPDGEKGGPAPDFGFGRFVRKEAFSIETREFPASTKTPGRPRVKVTFEEAREHCRKAGGDLPDEEQWEAAARGASYYRPFPFGESIPATCHEKTGPQCADEKTLLDLSPWGVWNMGSGVAEWVRPTSSRPVPATMGITKGGTTGDHFYWNIVPARRLVSMQTRSDAIGFRCVFPVKNQSVP
jgi:formylglycine-generating enzyme required for sulfatase activity